MTALSVPNCTVWWDCDFKLCDSGYESQIASDVMALALRFCCDLKRKDWGLADGAERLKRGFLIGARPSRIVLLCPFLGPFPNLGGIFPFSGDLRRPGSGTTPPPPRLPSLKKNQSSNLKHCLRRFGGNLLRSGLYDLKFPLAICDLRMRFGALRSRPFKAPSFPKCRHPSHGQECHDESANGRNHSIASLGGQDLRSFTLNSFLSKVVVVHNAFFILWPWGISCHPLATIWIHMRNHITRFWLRRF